MPSATAAQLDWPVVAAAPRSTPAPEPEPQDLTACLAGPNGLDLVVELAHDLRSPLTSILFLAEALQQGQGGKVTPEQSRQLGLIYSAALCLCATASDVQELVVAVRRVLVSDQVKDYIISLANATRTSPELRLGASPRAALHLLRASRAWAALDGRDYVIPDDVQRLARPVLAHRLLPTAEAIVERHLPEHVVDRIVAQLPLPRR